MSVKIYEWDEVRYEPGDDPQHWFPGKPFAITPDKLTFFEDACQGPQVTRHRDTIAHLMMKAYRWRKDHTGEYGLPHETKPVDYLEISCTQTLVDVSHGNGFQPAESPDTWRIIVRSPAAIEMPFYHGSYVTFRRPTPTS